MNPKVVALNYNYEICTYTGIPVKNLYEEAKVFPISENIPHSLYYRIRADTYQHVLKEAHTIGYTVFAIVYENDHITNDTFPFKGKTEIEPQTLTLQILAESEESQIQQLYISFTNPLNMTLTNVNLHISGVDTQTQEIPKANIPPFSSVQYYEALYFSRPWKDISEVFIYLHTSECIPFPGILTH